MEIHAPFAGIVHYRCKPGEHVSPGHIVATVEAVKVEANVVSPGEGIVEERCFADFSFVTGGDTLLSIGEV